jgi:hypothetical protein
MSGIDVPIALPDFEIVRTWPQFTLVYPLGHSLSQAIGIDMRVRLLGYTEEDFYGLLQKDVAMDKLVPKAAKYFDITYIREVMALGVTKKEWELSYGPDSLKTYCSKLGGMPSDYLKVISLHTPSFSLKN